MSTHVTIREVALRDGLQIEAPIPLAAKLDLLAAIAVTGVVILATLKTRVDEDRLKLH